jgi:[ribosomal protein S5]-alanine N-acetyltransferase
MSAFDLRLDTDRLTLVPFTLEFIAALERRQEAERLLGARIPDDWPDEELSGLVSLYADWVCNDPTVVGYGPWIVIARDEDAVVGSAGFIGKPDDERTIELGFGSHADYRNRGYASEAARALVAWGLEQPGVERVIAKCDPDNLPSVRVLEKIGMNRVSDADGQLLWEVAKVAAAATTP